MHKGLSFTLDNIKQMYLKIIVGTAECSLNRGARCCIEVSSHSGRGTVVADFIQCLRVGGRQVTPGGNRGVSPRISFSFM